MSPLKILTPEKRQITNRWRESQPWSPNEASAHAGRGPVLLSWAGRPQLQAQMAAKVTRRDTSRMCSTPENWHTFEPTQAYGIKEPKCPRQVEQISFELITYKVFRICSFKILYAKGMGENGRIWKVTRFIASLFSKASHKLGKYFLAFLWRRWKKNLHQRTTSCPPSQKKGAKIPSKYAFLHLITMESQFVF